MRVLAACEFSGVVRDAFQARGHDAWSCDLLPSERPGPHIQGDVLAIGMDELKRWHAAERADIAFVAGLTGGDTDGR